MRRRTGCLPRTRPCLKHTLRWRRTSSACAHARLRAAAAGVLSWRAKAAAGLVEVVLQVGVAAGAAAAEALKVLRRQPARRTPT
jgi:hypothetical protein